MLIVHLRRGRFVEIHHLTVLGANTTKGLKEKRRSDDMTSPVSMIKSQFYFRESFGEILPEELL